MKRTPFAFQSKWYNWWEGKSAPSPHLKLLKYSYNFWFNEKKAYLNWKDQSVKIYRYKKKRDKNIQKGVRHLLFQQSQCLVSSLILFVFSIVPVHSLLHYSALKGKFCIQFGIIIPIWSRHAPSRWHRLCKWTLPKLSRVFAKKAQIITFSKIFLLLDCCY